MGLEPGDLVERYTVIGVVGHCGMAMVRGSLEVE